MSTACALTSQVVQVLPTVACEDNYHNCHTNNHEHADNHGCYCMLFDTSRCNPFTLGDVQSTSVVTNCKINFWCHLFQLICFSFSTSSSLLTGTGFYWGIPLQQIRPTNTRTRLSFLPMLNRQLLNTFQFLYVQKSFVIISTQAINAIPGLSSGAIGSLTLDA